MIAAGSGKHKVWIVKQEQLNGDIVYILGGGEKPHIGGVVIKVPGEEIQVIKIGIHKDFHVLIPIAEDASKKYNTTVVVVGGIHIDNATREDIDQVIKNCEELHKML